MHARTPLRQRTIPVAWPRLVLADGGLPIERIAQPVALDVAPAGEAEEAGAGVWGVGGKKRGKRESAGCAEGLQC
jgi:hypothetical protein